MTFRSALRKKLGRVLGDNPRLIEAYGALEEARRTHQEKTEEYEHELERLREERLSWQAKESTTRKELQDCQARSKDLLEQVVQLTHRQRQTQKSLLDQQFKTETVPLERNRFEMELTEARGRVRRAEDRVKQAEANLARARKGEKQARKQAARLKDVESRLAWATRQAGTLQQALAAAIEKIRDLEEQIDKVKPALRRYRKPAIRSRQSDLKTA